MSALSNAVAGLASTLKRVAGESATYSRGANEVTGLTSVPDTVVYDVMDSQGLIVQVSSYDWLFAGTDLLIAGERFDPRSGDRITATLGGVQSVYEVMPVGTRPCFEPADPDSIMVVVHTKKLTNA